MISRVVKSRAGLSSRSDVEYRFDRIRKNGESDGEGWLIYMGTKYQLFDQ
jgi:hypothetical protein